MAAPADAAIEVRGVGKRFRRRHRDRPGTLHEAILRGGWRRLWSQPTPFWAVRDVSFAVPRGSMVGVVGANGAGKTTLLRLVGGVLPPDEGAVTVRGRVGALEVGAAFHPELTGRECVVAGGVVAGLTRRAVLSRFDEVVEFAGLSGVIDDPLRTYSTGMRMRLAFAVAAHADPEVLLVDEVLAVGDARFQRKCLGRIAELRTGGCALLLVSHDTDLVARLCDRALLMERGRLASEGPAAEVVARYHAGGDASAGARLQHGQNRFGTGAVQITGVEVQGASGSPAGCVTSGGPLTVRLRYQAGEGVRAVFNVLLTRADGSQQHCCDLSASPVSPDAEGSVTLHVERLDLVPGQYFADVGAYEAGGDATYDYHWNVHPFVVAPPAGAGADEGGGGGGKGVLLPPHHWSLTP